MPAKPRPAPRTTADTPRGLSGPYARRAGTNEGLVAGLGLLFVLFAILMAFV